MAHYCFKRGCELEAQYLCLCLSFKTYCCEFHLETHLQLSYRAHSIDSIFQKPCEWTKDAIIAFLTKEKSKKEKLKTILLRQNAYNPKESLTESIKKIDFDLKEINCLIEKICQIPGQIQILNSLLLQPDVKNIKTMIQKGSELYNQIKIFYKLNRLRKSVSEILNRVNNDSETERYFRKIITKYQNYSSNPLLSQAYQDLINAYHKLTSHYLIHEFNFQSNWLIYSTETESEEIFKNPIKLEIKDLVVHLPNGELFCLIKGGLALIFNKNKYRILPSWKPSFDSIAIYFDRNVYCFNGIRKHETSRFNLDENRWIKLESAPISERCWSAVIYNRNILISRTEKNILNYSIDLDSFSTIPYMFSENRAKILINAEDRLYLIEFKNGSIYESDAGDVYAWEKIAKSIINEWPYQIDYSYNKGGIYISMYYYDSYWRRFVFDLDKKILFETAFCSNSLTLITSALARQYLLENQTKKLKK